MPDLPAPLTVTPIGVVRSPFDERVAAPRQPPAATGVEGTVVLFEGRGYEDALCDLAAWDHLWLVVWFDRNRGFRPKVQPPRSAVRRGVFATRAPYRPNPIGMSAVRLLAISGLTLHVRGLDLLDGTPVLDLKPYVPYTDAIPDANHGWLTEPAAAAAGTAARPRDPLPAYAVHFAPIARAQLAYLCELHPDDPVIASLEARIEAQLSLGPAPHAYRRIRPAGDRLRLAVKDWRAFFRVEGRTVTVEQLASGYRPRALLSSDGEAPAAHRAFAARWPAG